MNENETKEALTALTKKLKILQERCIYVHNAIAFSEGSMNDMNAEMERLNNIIETSQEARSRSRAEKKLIMETRARFRIFKKALHGLLYSLYPDAANNVMDVLGQLMREKFNATSSGYIKVTDENYPVIQFLRQKELVSQNPYNRTEFKLV